MWTPQTNKRSTSHHTCIAPPPPPPSYKYPLFCHSLTFSSQRSNLRSRTSQKRLKTNEMGFLSVKTVAISTGIVSMAMGLKLTVPVVSHFLITEAAPSISTFFVTSLTPPYLYLLLNFIILTIFATSKLHHHHSPPDPLIYGDGATLTPPLQIPTPDQVTLSQTKTNYNALVSDTFAYEPKTPLINETVTKGFIYDENVPLKTTVTASEETLGLQRKDSSDFLFSDENTKPPASARFSHRKAGRGSPEGGKVVALGVAKPKRQDTLESTWRTITEGRAMPLTRHLKKSDTWESHGRRSAAPLTDLNGGGGVTPPPKMKKSETFAGRENNASPAGSVGKLRKEPSLSQDELNRRVEAFINKFNAEMRLQRQESLRQYREMINRRAQ